VRTRARVRQFIVDELLEDRRAGDPLAEELLDSLAIEQLVSFLEQEFNVVIVDEDMVAENFESLGAVASLVDRKSRGA
jgi:acyl carrier protein